MVHCAVAGWLAPRKLDYLHLKLDYLHLKLDYLHLKLDYLHLKLDYLHLKLDYLQDFVPMRVEVAREDRGADGTMFHKVHADINGAASRVD
jgi:hypothetical protein